MSVEDALQSAEDRVQKHLDQIYARDSLPLANLTIPIATDKLTSVQLEAQ